LVPACALARELRGVAGLVKVSSQLFAAEGPAAVRKLAALGFGIFLDLIVVPGVRPASVAANDQSRVATPGDAIRAGADYLVVGRPITAARDPRAAALAIAAEIAASV